jgi:hypothetical protein
VSGKSAFLTPQPIPEFIFRASRYDDKPRHIRILHTPEQTCYLAPIKFFKSVPELVGWYESHSLADSFQGMNCTLRIPYKKALLPQGITLSTFPWHGFQVVSGWKISKNIQIKLMNNHHTEIECQLHPLLHP